MRQSQSLITIGGTDNAGISQLPGVALDRNRGQAMAVIDLTNQSARVFGAAPGQFPLPEETPDTGGGRVLAHAFCRDIPKANKVEPEVEARAIL